jgi:hypothetical protein
MPQEMSQLFTMLRHRCALALEASCYDRSSHYCTIIRRLPKLEPIRKTARVYLQISTFLVRSSYVTKSCLLLCVILPIMVVCCTYAFSILGYVQAMSADVACERNACMSHRS